MSKQRPVGIKVTWGSGNIHYYFDDEVRLFAKFRHLYKGQITEIINLYSYTV